MKSFIACSDIHGNKKTWQTIMKNAKALSLAVVCAGNLIDARQTLAQAGVDLQSILEKPPEERQQLAQEILDNKDVQSNVAQTAQRAYQELEEMSQGVSVYSVPGNHDTQDIYQAMPSVQWLDKDGPKTIAGLNVSGALNTFSSVYGYPSLFSQDDIPIQHIVAQARQNNVEEKDLDEIVQQNAQNTPVYTRLQEEKPDVVVAHQGTYGTLCPPEIPTGAGVSTYLLETKTPVFCGHVHKSAVDTNTNPPSVRADPNTYFIYYTEGNKIIDIHQYKMK